MDFKNEYEYYKKHPEHFQSDLHMLNCILPGKVVAELIERLLLNKVPIFLQKPELVESKIDVVPVAKSPKKESWLKYRKQVWELTEKQPLKTLLNFEKRGFKNYHLDHRTSIWEAHKKGWATEKCADITNLQMIPYMQNRLKGIKSVSPEISALEIIQFIS